MKSLTPENVAVELAELTDADIAHIWINLPEQTSQAVRKALRAEAARRNLALDSRRRPLPAD